MNKNILLGLLGLVMVAMGGCGGDDDSAGGTGDTDSKGGDLVADTTGDLGDTGDTGGDDTTLAQESDSTPAGDPAVNVDVTADQGIGSACSCPNGTGNCYQFDIPVPNGGPASGCDGLPTDVAGMEPVCLRSYAGDAANKTYFANGYCALQATACSPATSLACIMGAAFGDPDQVTACPAGTVLLETSVEVTTPVGDIQVDSKICVAACQGSADCRIDETDNSWEGAATQYDCIDHNGVHFCYDGRNLPDTYTTTRF